jgi:hypothetical protein
MTNQPITEKKEIVNEVQPKQDDTTGTILAISTLVLCSIPTITYSDTHYLDSIIFLAGLVLIVIAKVKYPNNTATKVVMGIMRYQIISSCQLSGGKI